MSNTEELISRYTRYLLEDRRRFGGIRGWPGFRRDVEAAGLSDNSKGRTIGYAILVRLHNTLTLAARRLREQSKRA